MTDVNYIINEITDHLVKGCGGGYFSDYYVGITKDVQQRLFGEHNVPRKGYCYIFRKTYSEDVARQIERYFLDKGMKGGGGGGDGQSVFVYVYKIVNEITKE